MKSLILAVDNDPLVLRSLSRVFEDADIEVTTASSGQQAIALFKESPDKFPIVLLDYDMKGKNVEGMNGDEVAIALKGIRESVRIVMLSGMSDAQEVVQACLAAGAEKFICKSSEPSHLLTTVSSMILEGQDSDTQETDEDRKVKIRRVLNMVGRSREMAKLADLIAKFSAYDEPVLILGESGVGKEGIARAVHENSKRASKNFVAINCAAFGRDILESELFGHEKGSFTGALNRKIGLFEHANGGTIFLDEIGDMPLELQVKPMPASSEMFQVSEKVYFDEAKSQLAGDVRIVFDNSDIYKAVQAKIAAAIALNLVLALLVLVVLYYAGRVITGQLRTILNECSTDGEAKDRAEKGLVISEFEFLRQQMATHMAAARVNAETRAAGEIARQVKHDIRSPLAALNMLVKSIGTISEDRRAELFTAIQRINDISNDLTQKRHDLGRGKLKAVEEISSNLRPENVAELVAELVSEKELRFKDRSGVYFDFNVDLDGDAVFAKVCSAKFKRSLSNVLDNSVEAISEGGCVSIKVSQTSDSVLVSVIDTGSGIPPEMIPKLGEKGMTFNKNGGTGLGLYYAVKTLSEFRGNLTVNSDGISGTSVLLEIPKCRIHLQETQAPICGGELSRSRRKASLGRLHGDQRTRGRKARRRKHSL
ncbi:MAG: sigma 54-interacting transcriptional regulator [Bacteriovoracia bacterium]